MKIVSIPSNRMSLELRKAADARRSGKFVSAAAVLRKLARRLDKARKLSTGA